MIDPMSTMRSVSTAEARAVSALWWVVLLYGILSVIVGLFILGHQWTVDSLAVFIGIILLFEGVFTALSPGLGAMRLWTIGLGILAVIGGIAILAWPSRGLLVLAELIAIYIVIKGIFNLTASFSSRHVVSYWWLGVVLGILQIALGIWLERRPGITLYLVIILSGIWLLVQGALEIVLAFEIRRLPDLLSRTQPERSGAPPPSSVSP
jgi:uncharacterized membrane protein HdeD (DUF308 family)